MANAVQTGDDVLHRLVCPNCGACGSVEYVTRLVLKERYRLTYLNDVGDFDHDLIASVEDEELSYSEYRCGVCEACLGEYSEDLLRYVSDQPC